MIGVAGQGLGIAKEEPSRIFDRFCRAKDQQILPATGMGLAIAREIMDAHGEQIWVVRNSGYGSERYFSLPVARQGSRR